MSLANISIVGNLAREPEQFHFDTGRTKTTLLVAVNSFNKVRKEKTTDFYRVETWDRLAELAKDYLHKGNQVAVSGRLALERWVDREGKDRVTPTVQANQLAFPPRSRPDNELTTKPVRQPAPEPFADTETVIDDTSDFESQHNSEPAAPEVGSHARSGMEEDADGNTGFEPHTHEVDDHANINANSDSGHAQSEMRSTSYEEPETEPEAETIVTLPAEKPRPPTPQLQSA